jgi:5-methylthioadenosine/S-adenosylhomocysteine deaminase
MARVPPRFDPDDIHGGTLGGASSAQRPSHDHRRLGAQPAQPPAHTSADIQALADSGIRAMFLRGGPGPSAQADGVNADYSDEAKRLREGPLSSGQHGLLRLGLALRGPFAATPEANIADFGLARDLGLPISIHAGMAGFPKRGARTQRPRPAR